MKRAANRLLPRRLGSSVVKKLDLNALQDFYILLEDPHKIYSPGDQIKGEIFLTLSKNLANVTIDLSLIGNIKVKNSISTNSFRTKKKNLFNHVIRIYPGHETTGTADPGLPPAETEPVQEFDHLKNGLTKGQHVFPFIAQLPHRNIFTSILFEKGGISYKLKASIGELNNENQNPNFSCEKLLTVIKPINVAALPSSRVKTLIVKCPTKKLKKTFSHPSTMSSVSLSPENNNSAELSSPDSPRNTVQNSNNNNSTTNSTSTAATLIDKSRIKLSIEVPSLGYLRGELIPVKVSLQHVKGLKNSTGIIVTLIRICNVDFGPEGPIQSFRKDLSQTIAPLFVDPATFYAEVNCSVRVPADAFPTITGNDVVTFQYAIEVIVNLSGSKSVPNNMKQEKVQDDEYFNGQLSAVSSPGDFYTGISGISGPSNHSANVTNIFNVDKLKRMKNVLTLSTDVVIGTVRKERKNKASRKISRSNNNSQATIQTQPPVARRGSLSVASSSPGELLDVDHQNIGLSTPSSAVNQVEPTVLLNEPPAIPNFDNLTEKQLLQLREQTLLPSEPPVIMDQYSPSPATGTIESPLGPYHSRSSSEILDYVPRYEELEPNGNFVQQDPVTQFGDPPHVTENRDSLKNTTLNNDPNDSDDDDILYTRSSLLTQVEGINVYDEGESSSLN